MNWPELLNHHVAFSCRSERIEGVVTGVTQVGPLITVRNRRQWELTQFVGDSVHDIEVLSLTPGQVQ